MQSRNLPVHVPLVSEPWGFFKSLNAARKNVLSIIPEIAVHQPMVSGRTGKRWHMIMDPAALRRILIEKLDDYPKSEVTKNMLRPVIGESMFIAEGSEWRWQRRAAAPVFTHRNVANLAPIMTQAAEATCDRIAAAGPRAINMADEMMRATFEVISDVTLSGNKGFDRANVHQAINNYMDEAGRLSLFDMLGMPDWVPRIGRLNHSAAQKEMMRVANEVIDARRANPTKGVPDLLDLLLSGEDPELHRQMNTSELRDNLLTFIVAGHETTALTLSWALYLCAFDQDVQDRARTEAQEVLGDRTATAKDFEQLPFIRQVIDETMRLYPPAGLVSRTALKNDTLCGREVRAGDTVMIPIYALHRSHLHWDDPDEFRPDRFADRKAIKRFAYLPFADGPRICIGASFAIQEAVLILATLLARYRFTKVQGKEPKPVMILTLRPEGGVWLNAEPVSEINRKSA